MMTFVILLGIMFANSLNQYLTATPGAVRSGSKMFASQVSIFKIISTRSKWTDLNTKIDMSILEILLVKGLKHSTKLKLPPAIRPLTSEMQNLKQILGKNLHFL